MTYLEQQAKKKAELQAQADRWVTSRMLLIQVLGWSLFVFTGSFATWDILWITTIGEWPGGARFCVVLGWTFVTVVSFIALRQHTETIVRGW